MSAPSPFSPITIEGRFVRLEPLSAAHADGLTSAASSSRIWQYMPVMIDSRPAMESWITTALAEQAAGTSLPFAIIDHATGNAIGSTRFMDIQARNRGVEIGWTWLGPDWWRSAINTECKYLLLSHAFEQVGMIRVQFKTHRLNHRSRRALERLGAQFEGVLRNHVIMPDGTYRDSAYYSVIESEWPAVRRHLRGLLELPPSAA